MSSFFTNLFVYTCALKHHVGSSSLEDAMSKRRAHAARGRYRKNCAHLCHKQYYNWVLVLVKYSTKVGKWLPRSFFCLLREVAEGSPLPLPINIPLLSKVSAYRGCISEHSHPFNDVFYQTFWTTFVLRLGNSSNVLDSLYKTSGS